MIKSLDFHALNHRTRYLRRAGSAWVILLAAWFAVSPLSADITAEISITEHGHPPKPEGAHISPFDFGDGGECVRATKVIGTVAFHIKAPITIKTIVDKFTETEPELLKAGADGVLTKHFVVHEFSANGYIDSATLTYALVCFTDQPPVDSRSEAEFQTLLRAKPQPTAIEGIWIDQDSLQRVAFFEDPAQAGHYLGVQFDNGKNKMVPKGLIVADLRLQPDGWLVGHITFDDYARHPARLKMPAGDTFKLMIKKCTNGYATRAYPDKLPPEYVMITLSYARQPLK
jgi:hypothetical protein